METIKQLRVCYHEADNSYLYVSRKDDDADARLSVRYNVAGVNDAFTPTCDLLWPGATLNLLDVAVDEHGILTPRLFILEPDYLLDISSLAECFREYGHHPANYMHARLQPSENTMPLLLGNIANLFLDEWIHSEEHPNYLEVMQKAFRTYPIELATCADLKNSVKEKEFFQACKMHFEHIRQTVNETFIASGYQLDKSDALLEPSYICEPLGLQGRLDYMQRDMSAFIEMKSGKADEFSIRGKVLPKENNEVQMLLYQAVLHYSMNRPLEEVDAYLLYTRYPMLYPARVSWKKLCEVLDVRNAIVANEYGIQLRNNPEYVAQKLKEITLDVLNQRGINSILWQRYQAPQIVAFGAKLQSLTPLEYSYLCALYNFITRELYLTKAGESDYERYASASALWLASWEQKCVAGEILYDLQLVDNQAAKMHKPYLLLKQHCEDATNEWLSNFRLGDAVVLYQRNNPSDNVTNKQVFKGNIETLSDGEVRVRLRSPQRNLRVLPADSLYAIEHDYMDTAFRSMYQGLAIFMNATSNRRDLLLGVRPPEFDESLDGDIASVSDDFTRVALKAKAAKDYFLLVGPPGTGKTSRALRQMVETFHAEGKQLLLMAYTNRAVDEICKALTSSTHQINFIRMGSELACDEQYRSYLVEEVLADCTTRKQVQERLSNCQLFVGTVATLSNKPELFRLKHFDVAIIDEASQILEPQLLGLLCQRDEAGGNAIDKFVMIGDHKQLPAVVLQPDEQTEVCNEALREIGLTNLRHSLFERLYRSSHSSSRAVDMLCRQGRMNPQVAYFPNENFYGGKLQIVGLPHQCEDLPALQTSSVYSELAHYLGKRIAFHPSTPESQLLPLKYNRSEAVWTAKIAEAIYHHYTATCGGFLPDTTLGIIAPYRNQIALIRRELANIGIDALCRIHVDTVERFQGSERDVIIYSFCVNHPSQLKFLSNLTEEDGVLIDRKLNVALTRARKQ
ncbi:MAG: AAA family ATPase, partial [Bacteroides sp.]|nr:AAA family ATPase [Bacteroides sp.]